MRLTEPFSEQETKLAMLSMDRNSAPRPDGSGPAFYRAAWQTVKPEIMAFMNSYHNGDVQLERVNCSHMVPSLVIKLDFAKAFDTVSLEGLDLVLQARGFPEQWRDWIQCMLSTSKSAVLVNGCPGPWINCKWGLRQGDPLSPYLFLLVADTLQALIKAAADEIRHPVDQMATCAVFQYGDDTLVVLKGELRAVQKLKTMLDLFAKATGLTTNYNKNFAVPIHLDEAIVQECTQVLGCKMEAFPQNYLGLPLSANKLPNSVFNTFILKEQRDRYHPGKQVY